MTSSKEVQAIFDRIAPVYDQLNRQLSWGFHQVWKKMTVDWAGPKEGDRALDACCGSGDLAFLLARRVGKGGQVMGVDFSQKQLEMAREKAKGIFPVLPVEWREGDVMNLPFPEKYFDCATMGYGLRNVGDIPQTLKELYRVLKPGACAAVLDFNKPSNPVMAEFQKWYLDRVVVPTAEQLNLKSDYEYIFPSLVRFPTGSEQVKLGYEAGFEKVIHYSIALGLMGVLVLKR